MATRIGFGLGPSPSPSFGPSPGDRRWIDLPIDCPRLIAHLAQQGFAVAAPQRRICHWSAYLRPGLFALYRALIAGEPALSLDRLTPPPRDEVMAGRDCMGGGFALN